MLWRHFIIIIDSNISVIANASLPFGHVILSAYVGNDYREKRLRGTGVGLD